MHSLAFTTFVSRSSGSSSNASSPAPSEVAVLVQKGVNFALAHPIIFLGLAVTLGLVVGVLAYFLYLFAKRHRRKNGGLLSSLQTFHLQDNAAKSRPHDLEKGSKPACDVIDTISAPTLLFGTGSFVPNETVIGNSNNIGEMDITEARFEHDETPILNGEDISNGTQCAMESQKGLNRASDIVSREVSESIKVSGLPGRSSHRGSIINSGDPTFNRVSIARRNIVVISDEKGLEGAGLTKKDIDNLRNTRDFCNDEISVRAAALVTLADKFKVFEDLGEKAYVAQLKRNALDEPCSIGTLSSSSSVFGISDLNKSTTTMAFTTPAESPPSTGVSSPHFGWLQSFHITLESKEDAQATLLARRVDMQRTPELCFLIPNPVTREFNPYHNPASSPYFHLEQFWPKTVRKTKRYTIDPRAAQAYKPDPPSLLASGLVTRGPGCRSSKGLKIALRGLLLVSATIKEAPSTKLFGRNPALASSSNAISDKGSSSEMLVAVLKRMHHKGALAEPCVALMPLVTSTARSTVKRRTNTSLSSTQDSIARPSAGITAAMSPRGASYVSAMSRTADNASSSGLITTSAGRKRLDTNRTNLRFAPQTPAFRSGPETGSVSSACARMPTRIEEAEKDNLSLRSPPLTTIDKTKARRSSVGTSPASRRTKTVIPGVNKSSTTVKEKVFKPFHSPLRTHRLAIKTHQNTPVTMDIRVSALNELPCSFPSPPVALGSRFRLGPATVGLRARQASKPTTVQRSSLSENESAPKRAEASLSGVSRTKRHGLSDISNSRLKARISKSAEVSSMVSSPPDRQSSSVITSKASPAGHVRKSSTSIRTSGNVRPPQRHPARARRHPSGTPSSSSTMPRGDVPMTKGAFRD